MSSLSSTDAFRFQRFVNRQNLRGVFVPLTPRVDFDLPLDTEDAIVGLQPGDEAIAYLDLGGWPTDLRRAHERTQDRFTARTRKWTKALVAGTITLLAWHRLMRDEVKQHALQQALLGGNGVISDTRRVDGLVRRETDYLHRYADAIGREELSGREILNRATLYGGSGRGIFYREQEAELPDGYVVEYIARDDENTCHPCDRSVGYYLPGYGPYPGEVCLGHNRCRCTRETRFDPVRAAWLKTRL